MSFTALSRVSARNRVNTSLAISPSAFLSWIWSFQAQGKRSLLRAAKERSVACEQVSPFLARLLEHMGTNPAYITGRRWDVLAWNQAACQVFTNFATMPQEERNIVRLIFTNEEYRHRCVDWEGVAQRLLAQLRASSSQYRQDAQLNQLITELQQRSPTFARWWSRHEVQERHEGQKEFRHPLVGLLVLEHNTFQIEDTPGLKMVVYLPACEETARKLEQLALP